MAKKSTEQSSGSKARSAGQRGTPWTFPKNSLEGAIKIAQAIEEKNAGKPVKAELLATYVGFRKSNDWRFLDLLRSANLYTLVRGSGEKATVSLEDVGDDIVAPSSSGQRQEALLKAFNAVSLFKDVAEFYKGKRIPEDEYFGNTLMREFKVSRDRVETFIEVFTKNLQFLRAFAADREGKKVVAPLPSSAEEGAGEQTTAEAAPKEETGVREFLDTCFVLMPFGDWHDRYYKEIYVSAIKAAGFEPVRADDLFSAGSVMEQIWDEIRKAKVLVAELTGKHPNVFYELGLSHARMKPVVFVTADLADVPFDLRHLRVIPYDLREPGWADHLKRNITAHLKNTKIDPSKSIPQPFRDGLEVSD